MSSTSHRNDLFEYWERVPVIKIVDQDVYDKILTQDLRNSICTIIQMGLPDIDPRTNKEAVRHVFSAKEIRRLLEDNLKMSIKTPGLYFHLSKLEEFGIIKVVLQVKEKKNNVNYYSLTAKQFLVRDNTPSHSVGVAITDDTDVPSQHDPAEIISKQLTTINPLITKDLIDEVLEDVKDFETTNQHDFHTWFKSLGLTEQLDPLLVEFLLDLYAFKSSDLKTIFHLLHLLENKTDA